MSFLIKRYFDVVDASGAWAIVYDAGLCMAGLPLRYRELTGAGIPPRCRQFGLGRCTGRGFVANDIAASWDGGDVTGPCFENDVLRWTLTHLRSNAHVVAPGASMLGLGYGEEVVLKVPPWRLGLREVWWGRYLSPLHFLTWIVADGARPIRFGVCDGAVETDVTADVSAVQVGPARLELGAVRAAIASGDALAGRGFLAAFVRLFGAGGFALVQDKAVYEVEVQLPEGKEYGLAIAEHVRFISA